MEASGSGSEACKNSKGAHSFSMRRRERERIGEGGERRGMAQSWGAREIDG